MLLVGDLARLPEREAVDLLVVSAFPDDHISTSKSLVGALERVGVSVANLAQDKEVDLRQFSRCWLSHPIEAGVNFRRILCFEPGYRHKAPATEVVGDIFRSIVPFTTWQPPISQVAMPLVASGDMREPAEAMLGALVEASVQWLSTGLPLDCIKIVLTKAAWCRQRRGHQRGLQSSDGIGLVLRVAGPLEPRPASDPIRPGPAPGRVAPATGNRQ